MKILWEISANQCLCALPHITKSFRLILFMLVLSFDNGTLLATLFLGMKIFLLASASSCECYNLFILTWSGTPENVSHRECGVTVCCTVVTNCGFYDLIILGSFVWCSAIHGLCPSNPACSCQPLHMYVAFFHVCVVVFSTLF